MAVLLIGLEKWKLLSIKEKNMHTRELTPIEIEIESRNFQSDEEFRKFLDEKVQSGEMIRIKAGEKDPTMKKNIFSYCFIQILTTISLRSGFFCCQ